MAAVRRALPWLDKAAAAAGGASSSSRRAIAERARPRVRRSARGACNAGSRPAASAHAAARRRTDSPPRRGRGLPDGLTRSLELVVRHRSQLPGRHVRVRRVGLPRRRAAQSLGPPPLAPPRRHAGDRPGPDLGAALPASCARRSSSSLDPTTGARSEVWVARRARAGRRRTSAASPERSTASVGSASIPSSSARRSPTRSTRCFARWADRAERLRRRAARVRRVARPLIVGVGAALLLAVGGCRCRHGHRTRRSQPRVGRRPVRRTRSRRPSTTRRRRRGHGSSLRRAPSSRSLRPVSSGRPTRCHLTQTTRLPRARLRARVRPRAASSCRRRGRRGGRSGAAAPASVTVVPRVPAAAVAARDGPVPATGRAAGRVSPRRALGGWRSRPRRQPERSSSPPAPSSRSSFAGGDADARHATADELDRAVRLLRESTGRATADRRRAAGLLGRVARNRVPDALAAERRPGRLVTSRARRAARPGSSPIAPRRAAGDARPHIPLADAAAPPAPAARRTRIAQLVALALVGARRGRSRPRARLRLDRRDGRRSLLPATTAIVVLDVSASISSETYDRIAATLDRLADSNGRYGLVLFSDTAYLALPPGTAGAELRPFVRFFRVPRQDRRGAAGTRRRARGRTRSAPARGSRRASNARSTRSGRAGSATGGRARQRPRRRHRRPRPVRTQVAGRLPPRRHPAPRRRARPVAGGREPRPRARSSSRSDLSAALLARDRVEPVRRRPRGRACALAAVASRGRPRGAAPRHAARSAGGAHERVAARVGRRRPAALAVGLAVLAHDLRAWDDAIDARRPRLRRSIRRTPAGRRRPWLPRRPGGRDSSASTTAARAPAGGAVVRRAPSTCLGDRQRAAPRAAAGAADVALTGVVAAGDRGRSVAGGEPRRRPRRDRRSKGRRRAAAGRRSRRRFARTRRTPTAAYNLELILRRATRRRDARGAGIGLGRPGAGASRARARAQPGRGTDGARALDPTARSGDARARPGRRSSRWRSGASSLRRSRDAARAVGLPPGSLVARARPRGARRGCVRRRRDRGRAARPRDDRGARPRTRRLGGRCSSSTSPARCAHRPAPRAPTRLDQARDVVRDAPRRGRRTSRPGITGLTDRALPYVFPTARPARVRATRSRGASAPESPPPRTSSAPSRRAFAAAAYARARRLLLARHARYRTCVLVTDGEARTSSDDTGSSVSAGLTPRAGELAAGRPAAERRSTLR